MTEDKSVHYIRVLKNGVEDDILRQTWEAIGGDNNKDGWVRLPSAPPEVIAMKRKVEVEPKEPATVEVIGADQPEEVKSKRGRKPNENKE